MLWFHFLLLLNLARSVIGVGLKGTARIESAVVSKASVKTEKADMAAWKEQAATLTKEFNQISQVTDASSSAADTSGATESIESAFKIPTELQQDDWLPAPEEQVDYSPTSALSPSATAAQEVIPQQVQSTLDLPEVKSREEKQNEVLLSVAQDRSDDNAGKTDAAPMIRPGAAKGVPDEITFGIYAKNMFGIGLKDNNFVMDLVMSYKWTDPRVALLIPPGLNEVTLARKESEHMMWLPGMVITNRDIGAYDLISTAVNINRKGEVHKIERSTARIKNQYVLNDYPFDNQKLDVLVASSKYMIDEVVLVPSKKATGVEDGIFKGYAYDFVDHSVTAIRDVDGALKKSRGLLAIAVQRNPTQYQQSHLVPVFLISCISCGIFYFPFVAPFITPRVALSILALISFTNLSLMSIKVLPAGCPFNWNDLFNQTVMMVLFLNVCISIFSEVCFHQLKINDVAIAINMECKLVMPFTLAFSVGTIFAMAGDHSMLNSSGALSIGAVSILVKLIILLIVGSYLGFSIMRVNKALTVKRTQEAEAAKPTITPASKTTTNPNLKVNA